MKVKDSPDAVTIGDLDITGNKLTIEAFFNRVVPYTPANDQRYAGDIVSKQLNATDCNYLLRPTHCQITTQNGFYSTNPACDIKFNKLYHVAMVYDGSKLKFYRNGYLISEINATGNLITNDWLTTIGDIAGTPRPAGAENFNGFINEVKIWQVAKTQAELRSGMKTMLTNPGIQPGLLAYYNFNSLQNLQGNTAWNGKLVANAQINATNTACDFVSDSCELLPGCNADFWYKQNDCNPLQIQFFASDSSGILSWNFGDGTTSTTVKSPVHTFPAAANYKIQLVFEGKCFAIAEKTISMGIQKEDVIKNKDTTICENGSVNLIAEKALTYCWTPATYLNNPAISNPTAKPASDITYKLSSKLLGENLIVNGDFSMGNVGFTSAYKYLNVGWDPAIYFVDKSPRPWHPVMSLCSDHTTGNGNMLLVNGADVAGVKVWKQNITILPNSHYEFSCWVQNISSDTMNPCQLQFYINGLPLGPVFRSVNKPCIWTRYFTEWNSGPLTNIEISLVNQNTAFTGNDFALDDITFTPVIFKEDSIKITVEKPRVKANNDTTVCKGSLLQLNATGGLTYSWLPGTGLNQSNISNPIASPLTSTSYIVTGTTTNGCMAKDTVNILVGENLKPTDFSFHHNVCDISEVQFFNSGASPVYWNFGDGSPTIQQLNPVHKFSPGSQYTISVWSPPGQCQKTDTIVKVLNTSAGFANIITTNDTVICAGKSLQLNAVTASEYCWTPPSNLSQSNIANPIISPGSDMTYYLTAKIRGNNLIVNGDFSAGNTGFISKYNYATNNTTEGEYFVGTNPQAWNPALSKCNDHTNGTGSMMLVNGAPTADVNVWSQTVTVLPNTNYEFSTWIQALWPPNPAQLQFSINGVNLGNIITPVLSTCNWTNFNMTWNSGQATSATISIVNQNTEIIGNDFALDDISFASILYQRDSVSIKVNKPIVRASNDTTVCPGSVISLSAQGATSYQWSPATGLSDPNLATVSTLVNKPTAYQVTGTNAFGCTATDTVLVSMLPIPQVSISPDTSICDIGPIQLSASGGIAYQWSPANSLNDHLIPNPIATPLTSTKYHLIVEGANGCFAQDSVFVAIKSGPMITVTKDTAICTGSAVSLNATGGLIYKWTPTIGLSDPNVSNPIASPLLDTRYKVTVTNQEGCSSSDSILVGLLAGPKIIISNDTSICKEGAAFLSASGATSYSWTPAVGLNNALIGNPIANPVANTTYTVNATASNGCVSLASVRVSILPAPVIKLSADTAICINSSVQLSASGGSEYKWLPSTGLSSSTIANPVANPGTDTKYYVEVKDISGCMARDSVTVSYIPPAKMGVQSSDITGCAGEKVQLTAFGGQIYTWNPPTGLSNAQIANPVLTLQNDGYYQVSVKETQCNTDGVFPVRIKVETGPPVLLTKSNDITCNTPTAILNAGISGLSYTWTPATGLSASNIPNPVASPVITTTYQLTVQGLNGCTSKGSLELKVFNNADFRFYQLPNAFTPNGDGNNDCFGLSKWGNVSIIYFEIFNRWGEMVFNGKKSGMCWDGTYKGIKQPGGNYVYKLQVQTMCGIVDRKGYVILIR